MEIIIFYTTYLLSYITIIQKIVCEKKNFKISRHPDEYHWSILTIIVVLKNYNYFKPFF